jgi:hypothetical protein
VLGGREPPPGATTGDAAALAAQRRRNLAAAERLEREAQAAAARRQADADARAAREAVAARAREANAARAAADAERAARDVRAAWAGSALFDDALTVLQQHPDNAPAALPATLQQLASILAAAEGTSACRRLNVHSARFPNVHGALAALLALGWVYDDDARLLVLPDGFSRAALAEARGRVAALLRAPVM